MGTRSRSRSRRGNESDSGGSEGPTQCINSDFSSSFFFFPSLEATKCRGPTSGTQVGGRRGGGGGEEAPRDGPRHPRRAAATPAALSPHGSRYCPALPRHLGRAPASAAALSRLPDGSRFLGAVPAGSSRDTSTPGRLPRHRYPRKAPPIPGGGSQLPGFPRLHPPPPPPSTPVPPEGSPPGIREGSRLSALLHTGPRSPGTTLAAGGP